MVLSPSVLFALAAIGILGPFGTDVYLPALPAMAREFAVSPVTIQFTLTAFTLGMALGQIILGPLSDRFGRRPFILGGSTLTIFISSWAALAQSASALIFACGLLGLAAAGGLVTGRAVVSDLVSGREANRGFSLLGMMVGIGPILAPVGGAIAMAVGGSWRSIFWALAGFALVVSVLGLFLVPESLKPEDRHSGGFVSMVKAGGKILGNRIYLAYGLVIVFSFGAMFGYIAYSSYIIEDILGWTPSQYSVIFACNGILLMFTGMISARLAKTWDPRKILRIAITMNLTGALGMLAVCLSGVISNFTVLPLLALMASSMGFLFGPATAVALIQVRQNAGTALALTGATQFVIAGIVAVLVGIESSNRLLPFSVVVSACTLLAGVCAWLGGRASRGLEI
mgnify:CR=1 FL=1